MDGIQAQTGDLLSGMLEGGPAVSPAIERVLTLLASQAPRADILEPFVEAARDVIATELDCEISPGKLAIATGAATTLDVTAVVGITGQVTGIAMFGMPETMAIGIVEKMLGTSTPELDDLSLSGIAELANVITGRASTHLAKLGVYTRLVPPIVLLGAGSRLSTASIHRLVVPLATQLGTLETQLALKVTSAKWLKNPE
jgi:chemotaxis protein CheX